MKIGPSTWPMNTVAAVASAGGPRRPINRSNTKPKPSMIHFRIRQCQSNADSAQITRITGRTRKANTKRPPGLFTAYGWPSPPARKPKTNAVPACVLPVSPSMTVPAPASTARALGSPNSSSTRPACTASAPIARRHGKALRFSDSAQQIASTTTIPSRLCAFSGPNIRPPPARPADWA